MRRRALPMTVTTLASVALLMLTACGSTTSTESGADGSDGSSSVVETDTSATDASDTETTEPAPAEEPADTEVAPAVPADQMPTATGDFGEKPTITMPANEPPDNLQRVILSEGAGPVSKATDTVVVDYLGQVWGGDVFDNSYDRGAPFVTQIGGPRRTVVAGWDIGLQGVAEGSRVMLSFPPRDGYGAQGSPPNIGGMDTLVFVVDVIGVYPVDVFGEADAVVQEIPAGWPTVSGKPGQVPTVEIPSTLPEPAMAGATLIAEGTGEPAQAGAILVQYVAVSWEGLAAEQSWPDESGTDPAAGIGVQMFPLSAESPFGGLIGMPIGSRALVRTPRDEQTGMPPIAWVVDLIAQQNVASEG